LSWIKQWLEVEEENQDEALSFSGDCEFSYSDRIRIEFPIQ